MLLGSLQLWGPLLMGLAPIPAAILDDPIVIRAMTASTIAEIFVDENELRVELEIAVADLRGFANSLPEDLYARLGLEVRPTAERLEEFFNRDLVIRAGDGPPLIGTVESVTPRRRVIRDEITGEPLPGEKGQG
ncbi:MAG: hypothetical protein ACYTG5_17755, partial [Planctomycetota bacterium]